MMKDRLKILLIFSLFLTSSLIAQNALIPNVPDHSQPPAQTLPSTTNTSNYCSPFAALNIVEYWDLQMAHAYAVGMTAGLPAPETAEYIGWFMGTNGNGSPERQNFPPNKVNGTYNIDQQFGFFQFTEFDSVQPHSFPYPVPAGKRGSSWEQLPLDLNPDFMMYATEIDDGWPAKIDFSHWNIMPAGYDTLLEADSVHIYKWGDFVPFSGSVDENDPPEQWNDEEGDQGIGHAVTGVGYMSQFSIPGSGDPPVEYIIVHDNWPNTPENIAVPWHNVKAMLRVHLPVVPDLTVASLRTYVDSLETDTLYLNKPVMVGITIKDLTLPWIPPFILITAVLDTDGTPLLTDTSYVAYMQNKQAADSMRIYLDSLFTPVTVGSMDIQARVYWDMNADSLMPDPPDADSTNDFKMITRPVGYHVIYTTIMNLIAGVPDFNQPPATNLPSTLPGSYCGPLAAANILKYWESIGLPPVASQGVAANLPGKELAEYIGWFVDTNNHPQGNPNAFNGTTLPAAAGTYVADLDSFIWHFIRWDSLHPYMAMAPTMPPAKQGYNWPVVVDHQPVFADYQTHITNNSPVLLNFRHWNVHFSGTIFVEPQSRDTVYLYNWGNPVNNAQLVDPDAPEEAWNLSEDDTANIGHAVTGVGYVDHGGYYAVVHDNWSSTHEKVCIPWQNLVGSILLDCKNANAIEANDPAAPLRFELHQNYPNPFNPITFISWQLAVTSDVELSIYNLLGQKVATLVSEKQPAGKHAYIFDGSNLSSGIYFYRIAAGAFSQVKKMVLLQ